MPRREWDKIDQEAERYYYWEEFCRKNDVTKTRNPNHVPKCYKCKGVGKEFDPITLEVLGDCPACGGRGCKAPKPKFPDQEIRSIVEALGKDNVQKLIARYNETRTRRL